MTLLRIFGLLGAAAIPAFLAGEALDLYWLRVIVKPLPVLALAAFVWSRGRRPYGRAIAAGLVLSALGDVLLEVSPGTFLAGVGAFLLAHVAYVVGFLGENRAPRLLRGLPFLLWGVLVVWWLRPGLAVHGMTVPVAIYTAVICTMMWRAAARLDDAPKDGPGDAAIAFAGALLFASSDTLIALGRFGEVDFAGMPYAIILLYWLGQAAIAASTRPVPVRP